jgi:L-rhamnose mutarotase
MQRIAFTMQLKPGFEEEYKRRHDEIWPELASLLREAGISNYSIYLDDVTLRLFAYMEVSDRYDENWLPQQPVMRKWWDMMGDVMETNPDNSPLTISLKEVFLLD